MKFLLDFFPIVFFFIAYKFFGDIPSQFIEPFNILPFVSIDPNEAKDAIYFATLVIILATVLQNISHLVIFKKIGKMQIISLGMLLIFGSMTLTFKDPLFIKWKLSIFNWLFAFVIILSQFIGEKPLIERMMSNALDAPKKIWTKVNLSWGLFFAFVGFVNIYVTYNYSEAFWVDFKLFGVLGMTLVFMIGQGIYISAHVVSKKNTKDT